VRGPADSQADGRGAGDGGRRCCGQRTDSPELAQDHTQEFFIRILEHDYFDRADRERGRFLPSCWPPSSFTCAMMPTGRALRSKKRSHECERCTHECFYLRSAQE
jgi:hypothetical protein